MFDIHSHIIYHIDDGARTLDEAVELVKSDVSQGATDIISTSHYSVEDPTDPEEILRKLQELRERLEEESVPVQLYSGHEVLYFDSMDQHLRDGRILTLADSRYVLIEFYPLDGYQKILGAVRKLRRCGYRPVIAHAERFKGLREHGLSEIIDEGAYIQLSTEPLSMSGFKAMLDGECSFERKALKNGEAHFLGTDMHRMDRRPPVLSQAVSWVRKHLPEDYAEALLSGNAQYILKDQGFR